MGCTQFVGTSVCKYTEYQTCVVSFLLFLMMQVRSRIVKEKTLDMPLAIESALSRGNFGHVISTRLLDTKDRERLGLVDDRVAMKVLVGELSVHSTIACIGEVLLVLPCVWLLVFCCWLFVCPAVASVDCVICLLCHWCNVACLHSQFCKCAVLY